MRFEVSGKLATCTIVKFCLTEKVHVNNKSLFLAHKMYLKSCVIKLLILYQSVTVTHNKNQFLLASTFDLSNWQSENAAESLYMTQTLHQLTELACINSYNKEVGRHFEKQFLIEIEYCNLVHSRAHLKKFR